MKIALRLLLALTVAFAVAACRKDTQPTPEPTPPETTPEPTEVTTAPALDPYDYTDARNFDNNESLLNKRVIYFDFDKSEIKPEYRGIIAAHAAYLASNNSARLTLEGHADERGTREYNLGLGERRGNAITRVISAGGAMGSQQNVVSYGEERPVCRESNEGCWWMNRRVEIVYTAR